MKLLHGVVLFLSVIGMGVAQKAQVAAQGNQAPTASTTAHGKIDPAKEADIRRLLDVAGSKRIMQSTIDAMSANVRPLVTNALPPGEYREKLVNLFFERFQQKIDLNHLIDLAVPVYDKYYSAAEIRELIKFYETPVGQKFAATMPQLTNELREAGQEWGKSIGGSAMQEVLAEHKDLADALDAAGRAAAGK